MRAAYEAVSAQKVHAIRPVGSRAPAAAVATPGVKANELAFAPGDAAMLPLSPLPFALPSTPLRLKYAGGDAKRSRARKTPFSSGTALVTDLIPAPAASAVATAPFTAAAAPAASLPQRPPALWQAPLQATLRQQRHGAAGAPAQLGASPAAVEQYSGPIARPIGMLGAAALRSQLQQRQPRSVSLLPSKVQWTSFGWLHHDCASKHSYISIVIAFLVLQEACLADAANANAMATAPQASSRASAAALEAIAGDAVPEALTVAAPPAAAGPLQVRFHRTASQRRISCSILAILQSVAFCSSDMKDFGDTCSAIELSAVSFGSFSHWPRAGAEHCERRARRLACEAAQQGAAHGRPQAAAGS